ncbi:MAG TPA: MFS transporter [Burkholderiales bacterium]|nr:MFS transporter [Burkholderiales bacterium]
MSSSPQALTGVPSGKSAGLFDFYREMDAKGRRTFWACTGGFAMDAMDFMMFPLIIGTLIAVWKITPATAGGIATVTLWCSAIGGWLAGYLADRIGRVRVMQLTILFFSVGSVLSAFAQDPLQLTIFRGLLGVGFGGEAAVAAVALSEVVSARTRGRAMGFYACSYSVGWAIAVILQAWIFLNFPADTAWRVLMAVGVLPALLIFFIRASVEEPALSAAARKKPGGTSLFGIFSASNIGATLTGSLITIGAQGGFYSLMIWMPQFLRAERKITIIGSMPYLLVVIGGGFAGYATGGWLADRLGRRFVFITSAIAAASLAFVYTHVPFSNELMLFLGFPLGFFASAYYSAILPFLNELFPTSVRASGVGFTYNAGRAVGGLFPFLVGWLAAVMPLSNAITALAVVSYGLMLVTAMFMQETNGEPLQP